MADVTISQLPLDATLTGTEEVPIMDAGVTKKTTVQDIANLAAGGVSSVNGETGIVVLDAADVGADPAGTASELLASHVLAPDPHPGYLTPAEGDAAYAPVLGADDNYVTDAEKTKLSNLSGTNTGDQDLSSYALTSQLHSAVTVTDSSSINLTLTGQDITADVVFGTTAGTVAQGNDPRFVTNGNSHDHAGGDGAQIAYSSLSGLPAIPSVTGLLDETAHDALDHTGLTGVPAAYTLPTASTTVLGGVKVDGTSITITDGVVSAAGTGTGDVVGPASAINNNIAVFDGITGKIIKDSGSSVASFEAAGAVSGHVSTYDHSKLHDAVTVSGNGISVVGQQVSLSIGTGATQIAQGDHAHTGVYEPADATILKDAAIGVTVQAYDADLTSWAAIAPSAKQDTLVSGTNIKTINSTSILGSGDIVITGGSGGHIIQEEGTSLASRTKLNFVGSAVTVTDDSDNDASVVTITSSAVPDESVTFTKLAFDGGRSPYAFFKLDSASVAFTKTSAATLSIKAGTFVLVGDTNTMVSWSTATAVVMPTLTGGTDYAIYACTDGTCRADASFTAPSGYTVDNSRLIGGFHYGLVAPGTTVAGGSFATTGYGMIWTQGDVDKIAGINEFSLWDLKWRPLCDPKGMVLTAGRVWVDIYLCSTDHIANGTSKAGTDIASGTVLPKIPLAFGGNGTTTYATPMWWDFIEIVHSHKKRMMRESEFVLAAFGVTENQSIDATASTYPTTQRNAGYTSKYGIEQASGHHWTWGDDSAGANGTANVANGGRGQSYNNLSNKVLLGGSRTNGANSGSRCANWRTPPTNVVWNIGVRAACDHLTLL